MATPERNGRVITIVNGYTQFHWRRPSTKADTEAIRSVMRQVKPFAGRSIAYPRIGAGLAKGDWGIILVKKCDRLLTQVCA